MLDSAFFIPVSNFSLALSTKSFISEEVLSKSSIRFSIFSFKLISVSCNKLCILLLSLSYCSFKADNFSVTLFKSVYVFFI